MSLVASGLKQDALSSSNSTASSLLSAARRMDEEAWRELVDRYSWLVFQWCRNTGLSAQDAGDVVQSVFAQVAAYLADFRKDGKNAAFRRWLRTITRTKVADFLRVDPQQPHGQGGSSAQQRMLSIPDGVESSGSTDPQHEAFRNQVWKLIDQLEDEFEESTWQAFWLTVVENQTAAEAAAILQMTPNAVRIAKWRVLRRLREKAGPLEADRSADSG